VDVDAAAVRDHEEDAILVAVESEVEDGDFDVVHLTGASLEHPLPGLGALVRRVGDVATRHGKRLRVGPL
jgi:hypothetical protein